MRIPRDFAPGVFATPSPDGSRFASLKLGEAEGHIRLLANGTHRGHGMAPAKAGLGAVPRP